MRTTINDIDHHYSRDVLSYVMTHRSNMLLLLLLQAQTEKLRPFAERNKDLCRLHNIIGSSSHFSRLSLFVCQVATS